jgi:hypothetical protein
MFYININYICYATKLFPRLEIKKMQKLLKKKQFKECFIIPYRKWKKLRKLQKNTFVKVVTIKAAIKLILKNI